MRVYSFMQYFTISNTFYPKRSVTRALRSQQIHLEANVSLDEQYPQNGGFKQTKNAK